MYKILDNAKQALFVSLTMFLVCGLMYPLLVTGIAQGLFNYQADGSIVAVDGKAVGSEKLGQAFSSPAFFGGRVSSINYNVYTKEDILPDKDGAIAYGGVSSGTFNYAPSNPKLTERIEGDIQSFLQANPTVKRQEIPADFMTASGSGLDPHISVQAAKIQMNRIANASGLSVKEIEEIVVANTESRTLGVFGEEKVNFLMANLDIFKKMKEHE